MVQDENPAARLNENRVDLPKQYALVNMVQYARNYCTSTRKVQYARAESDSRKFVPVMSSCLPLLVNKACVACAADHTKCDIHERWPCSKCDANGTTCVAVFKGNKDMISCSDHAQPVLYRVFNESGWMSATHYGLQVMLNHSFALSFNSAENASEHAKRCAIACMMNYEERAQSNLLTCGEMSYKVPEIVPNNIPPAHFLMYMINT